jgi:1,4-alpha-glucan branching enzyme
MFVHPGKKLLFMGGEIGQWREWNHDWQLDWEALGDPRHAGLQRWVRDLNQIYAREASLWDADFEPRGFTWIDCNDHEHSVVALIRASAEFGVRSAECGVQSAELGVQSAECGVQSEFVVAVVNFTPVVRRGYRLGVPIGGAYTEILNSDAEPYGGSNVGNQGRVVAEDRPSHGHPFSLSLTVPPLGFVLLKPNK